MSDELRTALAFLIGSMWFLAVTFAWAIYYLDRRWRPIMRGYLDAQCRIAGKPMTVVDPDEKPGRLLPPTAPYEAREWGDEA